MKKRALGRGLSALLPDGGPGEGDSGLTVVRVPLDQIRENPLQPRRSFDEEKLQDLAESIRVHGVVQPVVVTRAAEGYRLVVGERRTRAARLAGLESIPALVRELAPQELLEVALIENLQRQDLNPVEEAHAFSYLIREHRLTHEEVASRLGCSRPAISNALRLLGLPDEILVDLQGGIGSAGLGRAVLALDEGRRLAVWRHLVEQGVSVRQAEELIARMQEPPGSSRSGGAAPPPRLSADWEEIEGQLRQHLGTQVRIQPRSQGRGRVELHYRDQEELERLVELLIYLGERVSSKPSDPGLY